MIDKPWIWLNAKKLDSKCPFAHSLGRHKTIIYTFWKYDNYIIIIYFADVDECTAFTTECYSNILDQFFPFGDENGDILSELSDDGSIPISLNTGFVFFGTSYTTVFVSVKLTD